MLLKLRRLFATEAVLMDGMSRATAAITTVIRKSSNEVVERKINVNGHEINYVKTGSGPHPVLLLPGSMGSSWTDFKPQIENLDKSKMTVVAWDPPGYGKSRPPDRTFPGNFFKRDATVAHDLMKAIGFEDFSLIGWSAGGVTALVLAANYSNSVRRLITIAGCSYLKPSELEMYERFRNLDAWSEKMKAPLLSLYGEDYFRATWTVMFDALADIFHRNNGDICKDCIPRIRCPTLLVHGAKDVVIEMDQSEFLKKNITDSCLKIFENAGHNLHLQYPEEFNELATKFLLEDEPCDFYDDLERNKKSTKRSIRVQ